jgi:hypothetical protein
MTTEHIQSLIALGVVIGLSLFIGIRFKTDSVRSLVAVYIAASFLWFALCSLSPEGRDISFIKFLLTVFFMEQCSRASSVFLKQAIGKWCMAVSIIAHIGILFGFWRLNLWRTLIAVSVYWFVVLYFEFILDVVYRMRANPVDRRTMRCMVISSLAYFVSIVGLMCAFSGVNLWCVLVAMIVYPFFVMLATFSVALAYRGLRSPR